MRPNHALRIVVARWVSLVALAVLGLGGCGYRVVGSSNNLPPTIRTIAVPTFQNSTTTYRIEQRLTDAVVHELLARTRYHVVVKPEAGDAVLRGSVLSIVGTPVIFDTVTGRASTVLLTVIIAVRLEDNATGNVLYHDDNVIFREPYEISTDVPSFFEEEGPALDRMSKDFASRVVAGMLENF